MSRIIPSFIGKIPIPETRTVTLQLLRTWANIIGEYKNIESLFKELENTLPTHMFYSQAQEISMYLGTVMDENKEKWPIKCTSYIFVGRPKFPIGHLNCRLAGLLHRYFDEPDYKIKTRFPPKSQEEYVADIEALKKKEHDDEPCPEEKVPC